MKKPKGQGLLEFALILPILLLIILGIIEAAFLIQGYVTVQHAAREAARFAVTYQPLQGECLDGEPAPYPACPVDYWTWPAEPDNLYYARRVELIKQQARQAATGLRINDTHLGNTLDRFQQYEDEPGFFGVLVWGYPSFQTNCNDPAVRDVACLDHPGLEGLPVQVLVRHNVEIVDPLYRAIVEYVPVQANAQMINEGIQVGFGDVPPPDFSTNPDIGEPPLPPVTPPDETEPTVERPHTYYIDLSASATNTMPGERSHRFVATVTDELSQTVQGARVSFSTDVGGFSYSGTEPRYVEELTGAQGQTAVTLFGNRPGMAHVRAWLDYDGDNGLDTGEPFDEATKTWTVFGPYIVVSDHEVYPGVSSIYIDVMDHDPTGNPYRLLWCVITGTATTTSTVVMDALNVGAGGDATDLPFPIPADSLGLYRLETHSSGGECGASDLVAYSADVRVVVLPPDLSIASFQVPDLICPNTVFTMSVVVTNSSPGFTDQAFDVDFYLDPVSVPPPSPIGQMKQWVSGIGPYGMAVVNTLMWVGTPGEHQVWTRVDTSNYVDEGLREDNNTGVLTITTGSVVGDLADTGWRSPTANSADTGGDGNGFEVNPAYAYGNGGGSAESRNNGTGNDSDRHRYYNYGFNVPDGSTIAGIEVRLDWWLNSTYGTNEMRVDLSWDGGASWTSTRADSRETTSEHTAILGGVNDTWGRAWSSSELSNGNFRVRVHSYSSRTDRTFYLDWVPVRVTYNLPGECEPDDEPAPWEEPEIKPPGLIECQQLLRAGGFEGNPETIYAYWHAGEPYAYKHQSQYFSEGSMSMRLHASLGAYPECPTYRPYLWQTVTVPTDVYSITTMVVQGQRLVSGSQAPCSTANSPEADDVLYVQMQDGAGTLLGSREQIANGGAGTGAWAPFVVDVTDAVDLVSRQGQDVRVYFSAEHDEDTRDTWFYLDALECDVCTGWPIPAPIAGTATITGGVRVLVGGVPRTLQGVDVWAYSQGGQVYHTVTIQDGTYGFYNIPPGTYTIYSEVWVGGEPRFATTTVIVGADERRSRVNLFLL